MFDRLIVATDLSPASYAVVRCLGRLRTLGAEHCLLLQCISTATAASTALLRQLVAMATQGRGFVGELVLGSVSHKVVRRSPAPLLLIPPRA